MSSAEQKVSETTGGSKIDNSPHPSMNKISHSTSTKGVEYFKCRKHLEGYSKE